MTFCHAAKNYRIRQPPALYSNIHSARCVDGAIENRKRNIPPCELIHAPFLEKHVFFDVSKSLAHREKRIARRKFERACKNASNIDPLRLRSNFPSRFHCTSNIPLRNAVVMLTLSRELEQLMSSYPPYTLSFDFIFNDLEFRVLQSAKTRDTSRFAQKKNETKNTFNLF